jgi:peptidoglycan-N-acetylglucosamine deacetylase
VKPVKVPHLIQFFSKRWLLWNVPVSEKKLYLTFDDGPVPEVTPKVLEILGKYNVKATFFCVGENVQKHPELFQQLKEHGHGVGNHTFHHVKGWKTSTDEYLREVALCNMQVNSVLFRPPHGQITPFQILKIRKAGYKIVMWGILSCDFQQEISPEQCLQNVLKNVKPGHIIVFHDSIKAQKNMLPALDACLKELLIQGYSFEILKNQPFPR